MQEFSDIKNLDKTGVFLSARTRKSLNRTLVNFKVPTEKDISEKFTFDTLSFSDQISSKSDFNFKHVSRVELEAALKRVRRQKQKKRDEEEWKRFIERKSIKDKIKSYCSGPSLRVQDSDIYDVCSQKNVNFDPEIPSCGSSTIHNVKRKPEENFSEDSREATQQLLPPTNFMTCSVSDTGHVSHTYQLSPGLTKRLQDLLTTVRKMTSLLINPSSQSQPEDEDAERTIKRSLEFDAMFARNHLYEIQRLLKDTKQLTTAKFCNTVELESKISAALKSITLALQVYTRHVSKGSRVKYQQVVPIFQSIATIHTMIENLTGQRLFPMREEIEVACSYMKQVLLEISVTETKSVSTVTTKVPRGRQRHKPSADLSMYNRRQKEWRKKSAALARVKFGPPSDKKQPKKCESTTELRKSEARCDLYEVLTGSDKTQQKDTINSKEGTYRNATRAVAEDNVPTMMETIPHEVLDTENLCLDDNTFQTLKLLNGRCPFKEDKNVSENPSTSSKNVEETSSSSPARDLQRANNVKLVCCTEENTKLKSCHETDVKEENVAAENEFVSLSSEETTEALEYQQKINDYLKININYKDDKAVGIVDRLASRMLKEMILDFQHDQMDQVIKTLYKLEFE